MNRTIKEATVERYHYDNHDKLRSHLADFIGTYNFARRVKTSEASRPTKPSAERGPKPDRFIADPTHQPPGLNIRQLTRK